ncbi:2-C-methyl-D-erythritol 2,4-cyclodiphosphate synthase [Filifactor alocis]|uniref:2-C-methyl-D-erythritol 2,4-cyclodiphosphate synthase n=1 Tax=Filifactor alocis TaxID=143361 RepID=UPI0001CB7B4A|nr:2-C-methyl-D-erythritol 2,4-cyclodiphosphate synthase [Filifactor alocis]
MRIGIGYDIHQLVEGRKLIVGGVEIPHEKGLLGHSDADVLVHAIMDAILGALGEGDIGRHFPDSSQEFKDADSMILLSKVCEYMVQKGYRIGNIDAVIIAQRPKMAPYIDEMKTKIASVLHIQKEKVNIKATTTEKLGPEGREEGMTSQSVVLLEEV